MVPSEKDPHDWTRVGAIIYWCQACGAVIERYNSEPKLPRTCVEGCDPVDKIDEVKLHMVGANSLNVDTHTLVVRTNAQGYEWGLYNGSYLVMEPRSYQHNMLFLGSACNFELVKDNGTICLKVTAKARAELERLYGITR